MEMGFVFSEVMRNVLAKRRFTKSSIEDIVAKHFDSALVYEQGISEKVKAAFKAFVEEMRLRGIEIPPSLEEVILHGKEHDPKFQQLKTTIIVAALNGEEKVKIAFSMMEAVHKAHQEIFRREFLSKKTYKDKLPIIDHQILIPDYTNDMYFIPLKYAPMKIIEEHFLFVGPILKEFGLRMTKEEIADEFFARQKTLPMWQGQLSENIKNGEEGFIQEFRTGSAPMLLARNILKENGFF